MKLKIPEFFTYEEAFTGKRKTRAYIKVTFFVLMALIVFMALALYQQAQEQKKMAAIKPIVFEPTAAPTGVPTIIPEACPNDPADWTLVDIFPGDVKKAIEPVCVYYGLSRAVAWSLAIHEGYSRQSAADALGFTNYPMVQVGEVAVADNRQGHKTVKVIYKAPVPGFAEWYFTDDGKPAVSFSLRGCFRTFTLVGLVKQEWENDFSVICQVATDVEATNMLMCLDDHCYTSAYKPARYYGLYGYGYDHNWIWLGIEFDSRIDDIDPKVVENDRKIMMEVNGFSSTWDAAWLESSFRLSGFPLPENWKAFTNNDELQTIVASLNSQLTGGANP